MKQIDDFVGVASRYCSLIDRRAKLDVHNFIHQVREVLPLLYYHALQLPNRDCNDENIARTISHDQWKSVHDDIGDLLGMNNLYWEIFDPIAEDPNPPVAATIADDIADIWRDLRVGVDMWPTASDAEKHEIVWQWRFSFQSHWSDHVVDSMRAVNWITESYGIR